MMNLIFCMLLCLASVCCAEDYYDLLGVTKNADTREIRKAFKKLALKFHPDKNQGKTDAHEKFVQINKAYEVLKDEEMRKKYDLHGEEGLKDDFGKSWKGNYHSWKYYSESFGIYDDDPEIITLSKSDFVQSVLESSNVWFVNFYSPQCSHCHLLAPAWRELARELEGVVRIGAVNCEEDWMLCRQQNIHSYPSLIVYPQREKYQGSRDTETMIEYILQQLPNNAISLTSFNFKDLVSREEYSNLPWLVFTCKGGRGCIPIEDIKKISIALERMTNIATTDIENDEHICQFIICDKEIVFYSNLTISESLKDSSVTIDEIEARSIIKKVFQLVPEAKELNDESYQEMRNKVQDPVSSPWLIQFNKIASSSGESSTELKRLPALLPGVLLGQLDCQKYPAICASLYVQKYPTFILFKPGGTYEFHHGRVTAHDVAKFAHEGLASQVKTLTPEHFPHIIDSKEPWFIDFFAPWCPPCMQLLPEWRKASQSSGHLVNFGTVDCTVHSNLCNKYNIRSYPTTILYNNSEPHQFHGSHSKNQIEEFIEDILHPVVISLTPDAFEKLVEKRSKNEIWVIDFYAPWCGPCQQLAPQWRKLAKMLVSLQSVHIGQVDCQDHYTLCNSVGINSYPNIRLYPRESIGINRFYIFNGWSRDANSLQAWIYSFLPSEVESLSSTDFRNKVLSDTKPWIIDFYAPWCSHCQMFAPEFEKIAQTVKGKVRAGKLNCENLPHICNEASVHAYPTVVFYEGSRKGKMQHPVAEEVHTLTYNGVISFLESRLNTRIKMGRFRDEL